ncbi:uncharacterized protein LOC130807432 [Amaranthus tricolor]|uniref:uncharacterized protein LOC130807432 n=1 Tax=Amaranthus tricolor TaxID=29722 RepID=UPI00258C66B8|nr:uncharacterized protein LOC130807432 [Amaranthus tricolor]XP_057528622.1 uncharacterized protein LOC130807432 [Amaranthus tricolor]
MVEVSQPNKSSDSDSMNDMDSKSNIGNNANDTQNLQLVESLPVSIGSLVGQELVADKIGETFQEREDEQNKKESSVRVVYSSLPSRSKRKLDELLHQWSEWHAQHFMSAEDSGGCLESGEETHFPALCVGSEKSSAVSFSMDVYVRKRQRLEASPLNNDCSPLYDRGYAVGLASEEETTEEHIVDLREAPRCFNCGSYNHPLNECQKPINKATVSSARKQFLDKKNQNTGPRTQTRYYQESPGGKFDGLKPGSLSDETKKLLGLGELDPPPWLDRMRELGYPPGYLDEEEEDKPSGIAIFGDEETSNIHIKSELLLDATQSPKKMRVEFPGINAPIPVNADHRKWMPPIVPAPDCSWNQHLPENRWGYPLDSQNDRVFHDAYRSRNHINAPNHFSAGSSPPVHQDRHNYHPRESFSPRGISIPERPHYGGPGDTRMHFRPHFKHGSF